MLVGASRRITQPPRRLDLTVSANNVLNKVLVIPGPYSGCSVTLETGQMYGPSQEMKAPSYPAERQPVLSSPRIFIWIDLYLIPSFWEIVCS